MAGVKEEITWKAHPAREKVGWSVFTAAVILAVSLAVYVSFHSVGWSVLSIVLLVVSLNRFFFPSRFTIDPEGITARYPFRSLRLRWEHVRGFRHDQGGGYLSTRPVPSRFDAYRGMHILFGDQREAVIRGIRDKMRGGRCR